MELHSRKEAVIHKAHTHTKHNMQYNTSHTQDAIQYITYTIAEGVPNLHHLFRSNH